MAISKEIRELAIATANADPKAPIAYSFEGKNFTTRQLNDALRTQLKELMPSYNAFRRNKLDIFELMQEVIDITLPKRVIDSIGRFADVDTFGHGDKPIFKKKVGRTRAKSYITRAAASGVYKTFRLDEALIEVPTYVYGGAGIVDFERFLAGKEDLADIVEIVTLGLEDAVYTEVYNALVAIISSLPANNKHSGDAFDVTGTNKVLSTVSAYGATRNIFCTPRFAGTITPTSSFIGDADRADMRNQGYIGRFSGANVILLDQSFTDETNTTKVFGDTNAFVIPSGEEKIVKVALEGGAVVKDVENTDNSMEFQAYKKFGAAILSSHTFGVITNTSLT